MLKRDKIKIYNNILNMFMAMIRYYISASGNLSFKIWCYTIVSAFGHVQTVYALRINGYLPVQVSGSKINLPGSKMTCLDFCLNHLTLSDAQFLQLIDLWAC